MEAIAEGAVISFEGGKASILKVKPEEAKMRCEERKHIKS